MQATVPVFVAHWLTKWQKHAKGKYKGKTQGDLLEALNTFERIAAHLPAAVLALRQMQHSDAAKSDLLAKFVVNCDDATGLLEAARSLLVPDHDLYMTAIRYDVLSFWP